MSNKANSKKAEGKAAEKALVSRPAGQPRVLTPEKETQLARLKGIKDEDINFSDDPETTEEEWATAVRGNPFMRPKKVATAVRLDADVVHWLKAQGRGYQTRLNAYLRRMMTEELKGKAEGQSKSCLPATSRSGGI